jgi:sirohydrochlorin cobaltochelatase
MLKDRKRLILIAHGSKDPAWLVSFETLRDILKRDLGENNVRLAYMQFVSPTIEETVEEAFSEGIFNLSFLPLFMSSGGHVKKDIPLKIKSLKDRWPELNIELFPPLGEDPKFIELMREIAKGYL